MFGGLCFLLNGNMLVGVWKDAMIVRLGAEQGEEALLEPHVKEFKHHRQADEELDHGGARRCAERRAGQGVDSACREVCREAAGKVEGVEHQCPHLISW